MAGEKEGAASYEQLQEALFGPGANSSGGLPPGTDREEVRRRARLAQRECLRPLVGRGRAESAPSVHPCEARACVCACVCALSQFHADARKLTRRLRRMWAGLLNPASKKMENWDAVLIGVMLYTAFVTPCELAFVRQPAVNALFWCNQAVNLVFWADLLLQFFIPVTGADGRTVRSHKRIARIYLTGWFALDLVSILPFDILDVAGTFTSLGGNNEEVVKLIRLTRLLKLLKLLRILRASRILSRFQTRYALTYTASEMAKYTLVIIVTLHWFACAWAALATFSLDQPRTPSLMEAVALQQSGARTRNGDDVACASMLMARHVLNCDGAACARVR